MASVSQRLLDMERALGEQRKVAEVAKTEKLDVVSKYDREAEQRAELQHVCARLQERVATRLQDTEMERSELVTDPFFLPH